MKNRNLPQVEAFKPVPGVGWESPVSARERFTPVKAMHDDERTLNIYGEVGDRFDDGTGITANLVRGVLRRMGPGDVVVNINSPGGDFFTGLAVYNLLREHEGKVTTNVVGVAASAASLIAMASDELRVAKAGFLMIHNSWAVAMGNRNDMRATADLLGQFDSAMAGVYAERSGVDLDVVSAMMDEETFLNGEEAVQQGFADGLLPSDEIEPADEDATAAALRRVDTGLAKAGISRADRRAMIKDLPKGTPGATLTTTPGAGDEDGQTVLDALNDLVNNINA